MTALEDFRLYFAAIPDYRRPVEIRSATVGQSVILVIDGVRYAVQRNRGGSRGPAYLLYAPDGSVYGLGRQAGAPTRLVPYALTPDLRAECPLRSYDFFETEDGIAARRPER